MNLLLRTLLIIFTALMAFSDAAARGMGGGGMGVGGGGMGGFGGGAIMPGFLGADGKYYDDFKATGLIPEFPKALSCSPSASSFGSPSDSDGIDLTISNGTHLLAIADGDVVAVGRGTEREGNFFWLRFSPEATGQPFWTFAKYQHLPAVPSLEIGAHLKAGEIIHFLGGPNIVADQRHDANAKSLVHVSTTYGPVPEFRLGGKYQSVVKASGAKVDDPLILFVGNITKPEDAHQFPAERRHINVAAVGTDGMIYPPDSKVVWPVACHR